MGERVVGLIPVSIYPININSCYRILRVRVAGILRHISTYIIVTNFINTMIKSMITRGRMAGLLRPIFTSNIVTTMMNSTIAILRVDGLKRSISTSYIIHRHFKTFIIRNTTAITMAGGRIAGL